MQCIDTALLLPSMDINMIHACDFMYNLCNNTLSTYTMTILKCKRLYHNIIDLHKCYSHDDYYIE